MVVVSALPEPNDTDRQRPRAAPELRPAPERVERTLSRRMAALATVLVLACAVVTGCAAGSPPPAGATTSGTQASPGGDGSSSAGGTETFDSPAVEPTTPDTSDGSGSNGNPAISVARLPIGGDSQDDATDPALQCAHASWIANGDAQIPVGTGVEITGVEFTPDTPKTFESVSQGCGTQGPSCLHLVLRPSTQDCYVAVRATRSVPEGTSPLLRLSGNVFCPDKTSDTCRRFVAGIASSPQKSVPLNLPQLPTESSTTTDSTTTDTTTESSTTESSTTTDSTTMDSTSTTSSGG